MTYTNVTNIPDLTGNEKVRFTPDGGLAVKLINATGSPTVYGQLVCAASTTTGSFQLSRIAGFDTIGATYQSNISDGAGCWVVIAGMADVMVETQTVAASGDWIRTSTGTAGRAIAKTSPAGLGAVDVADHFKEIGHVISGCASGAANTAKIIFHFL